MTYKATHIVNQNAQQYATGTDFCRIFKDDMDRLYLLSFLLTSDHARAEECFVQGLEDAQKGNPVFKEWARSWARRTIIAKAIRMVSPRIEVHGAITASGSDALGPVAGRDEIAAVLALPVFERFAFVISVLEGYSERESALLLNCSIQDLIAARSRALRRGGAAAELRRKLKAESDQGRLTRGSGIEFSHEHGPRIAASA